MKLKKALGTKRWKQCVMLLCCLTAFCTTYALILPAITAKADSYCGYEEHTHTEDCLAYMNVCDEDDDEVHEHTEDCQKQLLGCGQSEHIHTLQCFSNPDEDVETKEQWENTLPDLDKIDEDESLRDIVLEVADSQNNYKESQDNYEVTNKTTINGWNRFGAWDDDPYGEWSASFVQFILDYAGVLENLDEDEIEYYRVSDIDEWLDKLENAGMIYDIDTARAGDVLFVKGEENLYMETEIGQVPYVKESLKAGIITEINLKDETISAIMGDWSQSSKEITFNLDSDKLLGILPLPVSEGTEDEVEEDIDSDLNSKDETDTDNDINTDEDTIFPDFDGSVTPDYDETGNDSDELDPEETEDSDADKEKEDDTDSDDSDNDEDTDKDESGSDKEDEETDEDEADDEESDDADDADKETVSKSIFASDGAKVNASWKSGDLPEDVTMKAVRIEQNSSEYFDLENKIREEYKDEISEESEMQIAAYDITFLSEDEKVEPTGPVSIELEIKDDFSSTEDIRLIHLSDEGVLEDLSQNETTVFEEEDEVLTSLIFENDEFSIYAAIMVSDARSNLTVSVGDERTLIQEICNAPKDRTKKIITLTNSLFNFNGEKFNSQEYRPYIAPGQNIVIEMNGFTIERKYGVSTDHPGLFYVDAGASLTIRNSQTMNENTCPKDTSKPDICETYGQTYANYTNENGENVLLDGRVSFLRSKNSSVIHMVSGANVTLENVVLISAKENYENGPLIPLDPVENRSEGTYHQYSAIEVSDGNNRSTLQLDRAYLLYSRAGIKMYNTDFEMSGGAIANNTGGAYLDKAPDNRKTGGHGAGIHAIDSNLVLKDEARIVSNELNRWGYAGGIYLKSGFVDRQNGSTTDGSLIMESCFVSNNKAGLVSYKSIVNNNPEDKYHDTVDNNLIKTENYSYGAGGGIAAEGNVIITMSNNPNAIVSNNWAANHGGGIWVGEGTGKSGTYNGEIIQNPYEEVVRFIMRGGVISGNISELEEGGGLCLSYASYARAILYKGEIYGNRTNTVQHWGGGGVFCSQYSYLLLPNGASIYENAAKGLGAGLTTCPTGKTVIEEKVVMVDNNSWGKETSGTDSKKSIDRDLVDKLQGDLTENGDDYFGAYSSQISSKMANGDSAKWSGVSDGDILEQVTEGNIIASYVLGVTSNASESSKNANKNLPLKIYDNFSKTHGGGMLVNGYLISGETYEFSTGDTLELTAHKTVINEKGETVNNYTGKFNFEILAGSETGPPISTGYSGDVIKDNDNVEFTRRIVVDSWNVGGENNQVYYIKEIPDNRGNILWDETIYRITITDVAIKDNFIPNAFVIEDEVTGEVLQRINLLEHIYLIKEVQLDKKSPGQSTWTHVKTCTYSGNKDLSNSPEEISLTHNGTAFTNRLITTINLDVHKEWSDGYSTHLNDKVYFNIQCSEWKDNKRVSDPTIINGVPYELFEGNNWQMQITNLPPKYS